MSQALKTVMDIKTLQEVCDHIYSRYKEYDDELAKMDLNDKDYDWTEGARDGYEGASMILQIWIDSHKES